jgi:uncharacterized protein YecE (DUF72 family)
LMIHTPDNVEGPQLAKRLYQQLQQQVKLPNLSDFPANSGNSQIQMF